MAKHCIVADLHFVIDTDDLELLDRLAPRYAPFSRRESEAEKVPLLFSLHHVAPFEPLLGASQIIEFDCEGSWCLYEQNNEQISITLQDSFTHANLAQMHSKPDFSEAKCWLSGNGNLREYCMNNFLMMLFAFASMDKQTLLFHASVVACDNKAYLFLAKSGTGKSTHSALWLKHVPGCELVNDDNPVVGIREGEVMVYGSPWSGKTPCYRNVKVPVKGMVNISRSTENNIARLGVVQAFASLLPSCSGVKWDVHLYRAQSDSLSAIISRVPIYQLGCTPNREAAVVCSKGVGAWDGISKGTGFSLNQSSMKPIGVTLPEQS